MTVQRYLWLVGGCCLGVACSPRLPARLLRLEAKDLRFSVPDQVPGGLVRVRLVNLDQVWHEASIVRLDGAEASLTAYVAAARAGVEYPAFAVDQGGVSILAPGDSAEVILRLTPGRYEVICWHRDHVLQGMGAEFRVGSPAPSEADPSAAHDVALRDFAIPAIAPAPGRELIHLQNTGPSEHEFIVLRLNDGASLADYMTWRASGELGPAPARPVAGSAALARGGEAWVEVTWTRGTYILLCLLEDSTGTLHSSLGMNRVVTVP
ncbi:MAG: hypothetical protein ABI587_02110 [Gemmatimonadales bacterium]